jgi:outer membrane receptor for ferric coprogen and ferric-rhodotorulic acid
MLAAVLLLLLSASPGYAGQEAPAIPESRTKTPRIALDVPELPLTDALLLLSDQAGVQLLADPAIISNVWTPAVKGHYTVAAALERLLSGTGLRWRYLTERTITIERASSAPSVAAATIHVLPPVQIIGRHSPWPLTDGGSTDPTATEGSDSYVVPYARVASKSARPLSETPQSVSVLSQQRFADQNLTDIPDALQNMPGVSARMVDGISGWTFLSRGFEIHTFSFDGGGPSFYQSPIDADVRSMLDTPELAEFDHIEILRGAVGVFGGVSYPGGVINFQRKRPLDRFSADATLQLGSWNNRRIEADVSLPIAFDGRLRARAVGLNQNRDFFYDVAHEDRSFGYGMLEAEIGSNLLVRGGGSYRDLRRPGFNVAGLPRYLDGRDLGLSRRTCLCPASNSYKALQSELFFSGEWNFAKNWQLMVNSTWRSQDKSYSGKLAAAIIADDEPSPYFLFGNSYNSQNGFLAVDTAITGAPEIAGRVLTVTAGLDYTRGTSYTTNQIGNYGGFLVDAPNAELVEFMEEMNSFYDVDGMPGQRAAVMQFGLFLRLSIPLTSRFSVDLGLRKSFYRMRTHSLLRDDGMGATLRFTTLKKMAFQSSLLPSISASYKITPSLSVHATYTRLFQPQMLWDRNLQLLPSAKGATYEAKLGWFDNVRDRSASLAVYHQDVQDMGIPLIPYPAAIGCCFEVARRARSHGVDAEFAGTLSPGWRMHMAYNWTRARMHSSRGITAIDTQQPEHRATLWTRYSPASGRSPWSIGGGLRYESRREAIPVPCGATMDASGYCLGFNMPSALANRRFTQAPYIVTDLKLARRFGRTFEVAVNVTNLFDKRYYATVSLPSFGNYYGEPRAAMLTFKAAAER